MVQCLCGSIRATQPVITESLVIVVIEMSAQHHRESDPLRGIHLRRFSGICDSVAPTPIK